jgi:hypothetical protein
MYVGGWTGFMVSENEPKTGNSVTYEKIGRAEKGKIKGYKNKARGFLETRQVRNALAQG